MCVIWHLNISSTPITPILAVYLSNDPYVIDKTDRIVDSTYHHITHMLRVMYFKFWY